MTEDLVIDIDFRGDQYFLRVYDNNPELNTLENIKLLKGTVIDNLQQIPLLRKGLKELDLDRVDKRCTIEAMEQRITQLEFLEKRVKDAAESWNKLALHNAKDAHNHYAMYDRTDISNIFLTLLDPTKIAVKT